MSLLDEVRSLSEHERPCKAGVWFKGLAPEVQSEVTEALESKFPTTYILRVMERRFGNLFSTDTLERHRKSVLGQPGGCSCRF